LANRRAISPASACAIASGLGFIGYHRAALATVIAMPLPPPDAPFTSTLAGRVVVVTGAAGGLGRVLSLACAAQGATVVLHGRVVRKLEALYDEIVATGHPEPSILPLDLATAKAEDFANVASALQAQTGRVDAIVHTAVMLGTLSPIEHQAFDQWLSLTIFR